MIYWLGIPLIYLVTTYTWCCHLNYLRGKHKVYWVSYDVHAKSDAKWRAARGKEGSPNRDSAESSSVIAWTVLWPFVLVATAIVSPFFIIGWVLHKPVLMARHAGENSVRKDESE